eukprot:1179577-Prorocentrum_minimum.AAC.2
MAGLHNTTLSRSTEHTRTCVPRSVPIRATWICARALVYPDVCTHETAKNYVIVMKSPPPPPFVPVVAPARAGGSAGGRGTSNGIPTIGFQVGNKF